MSEALDAVWDRPLSAEEFARRERAALGALEGAERDEMRAFHVWFCRRYPTPLARLRYMRRQLASIQATQAKIAQQQR